MTRSQFFFSFDSTLTGESSMKHICNMPKKSCIISLVVYFLLAIFSVSSQKIPDYDELVLAQQWKRSSCCSVNKLSSPSPNCKQCQLTDSAMDWTIHGLWPTDSTAKNKVEFCPNHVKSIAFNKYPANLLNAMKRFWPNNKHDANNEKFWWYEWQKHGTCAVNLPETSNDFKYFTKTINLYNSHQVGKILEKEQIVPKHSYTLDAIRNGLKKNMQNHEPVIRCLKHGDITYLMEVYMCFTKQFQLKNCNGKTNCNNNVYYP